MQGFKMRKHFILIVILCLSNGYFIFQWMKDAAATNDVGRQWIRLIMPIVMLATSFFIAMVYFLIRYLARRLLRKNEQQA